MLILNEGQKVYIHTEAVDMRKAVNGLSAYVVDGLGQSPQSGDLYVFYNRTKSLVKILWWDKNGFVLHCKRIEQSKFKIPRQFLPQELMLTNDQLHWLLAGLDFTLMHTFKELDYSHYY